MLRYIGLILAGALVLRAADPSAQALARAAVKAQNSGMVVRAYMLYAEAAARDPDTASYRMNRDALKPLAQMLSKSGIEKEPSRTELLSDVSSEAAEPVPELNSDERQAISELKPLAKVAVQAGRHSFHARGDEKMLFGAVATAFGLKVLLDSGLDSRPNSRLDVDDVDLGGALHALTEATDTFVFAISSDTLFVARDTAQKRDEFEPQTAVTIPLPDISDEKLTTEAANAVRQAFDLRHIGIDTAARTIVIRDKVSRAEPARSMLETLIRPKAQIAIDVQIYLVDEQSMQQYGASIQNTFPLVNFGGKNQIVSIPKGFTNFLTFGGGRTLFGIGVSDAQAFANSTNSRTKSIYDATLTVSSGETAQLHVGDKYPIAQSLYTGFSQLNSPFQGPLPQIQQVDLGVLIKVKPALQGDGNIYMDIHAEYQALGTQTFNTVPTTLSRQFEGTVRLHTGQWAILAGLDTQTTSVTNSGYPGASHIPVVGDLFLEINRSHESSHTLLVLKPHLTRLNEFTDDPPYFFGGERGRRVLL